MCLIRKIGEAAISRGKFVPEKPSYFCVFRADFLAKKPLAGLTNRPYNVTTSNDDILLSSDEARATSGEFDAGVAQG